MFVKDAEMETGVFCSSLALSRMHRDNLASSSLNWLARLRRFHCCSSNHRGKVADLKLIDCNDDGVSATQFQPGMFFGVVLMRRLRMEIVNHIIWNYTLSWIIDLVLWGDSNKRLPGQLVKHFMYSDKYESKKRHSWYLSKKLPDIGDPWSLQILQFFPPETNLDTV